MEGIFFYTVAMPSLGLPMLLRLLHDNVGTKQATSPWEALSALFVGSFLTVIAALLPIFLFTLIMDSLERH
jgi:hypothetical protein